MNSIQISLGSSLAAVVGIVTAVNSFASSAHLEKTGPQHYPHWSDTGNIITLAEADNSARGNEHVIKESAEVSLTGKLKGGIVAIGGEHTGWVLKYQTKAGPQTIEVDISSLDAASVHEGSVRITGKIFKKSYVERGPVLILKASKIDQL